ncbi:30S ribosomal protein S18 [Candidatus Berkelbacteria bacterium CG_4_9_14_3_um_filter_39_23]|uniref:Small ribosomal subunit protein bS18 n=2 Tax=Candidatus Berkelbacteria TaxID=1618330 RepID=A0A2M7CIA2_9BACT|nr:30S ribosomal protein S18 [Candidatus Berkelbacteria bacterium]OIP04665.1 MAG: 30S ribosomal protein S18 [Candidatus Berkelbacteria bacterium CG2_30_39_44]PIR27743.1 MAG: 30S ribosomal protein S18 [Candidatus Berkelbacteria bacterium CG11_big_fil_rev_8_21_14_0_20_40_23]PIV25353.1 MAG: 30S ribosomal protein S18 [Candidatus Berkelbacteria bacterium CG03_land_8_20_14_0_80_40_36]PIZ28849.1 MAG: 30S ribosomal protein S18 [Candidatus Berkelbacteria bacterium CG_4_10_14_0_8_um_filter_39_42]PJB5112
MRKKCIFCQHKVTAIDFKETALLGRFLSSWAKIKPARENGTCAKHQRKLKLAIKNARFMGLMPFTKG